MFQESVPCPPPPAGGGRPSDAGRPHGDVPAPVRRLVRVGWFDLQVEIRAGAPGRTPLLMFGGIGAALDVLGPLVDAIDADVPVIRVDVPGIGGSPAAVPLPIPVLAGLMSELLDTLEYGEVDVLGYSWGGALAQQFAVQHAVRCRRLVLMSTNTGAISVLPQPSVLASLLVPRRVEDAAAAARLDDAVLHEDLRTAIAGAVGGDAGARTGWWGYLTQLGALMAWSSLPFLPLLTQETLIISGADDPIVPIANARVLAETIPRATLAVVPGGHFGIVHEAPDLGARISRFLS